MPTTQYCQSYGQSLPDQVDRIASLSDAQLELLSDVRELYQSRIALEREYAGKLQILANKAAERKSRKIASLVLGDEPSKPWGEDTIKQSTFNQAYSQLILSFVESSQDHSNLADALSMQVADVLRVIEKRNEDSKKKQVKYFQKLLADRDRVYSDRMKSKQKYDEECVELETYRQKQDRSHDDKHAGRIAKQQEQQQTDMYNSKNDYLISTHIANKVKDKFYEEDIPALENQYQKLQANVLNRLVKVLLHAQALTGSHFEKLKSRAINVETVLGNVDPAKDQDLFIDYNIRTFSAPRDWDFEPCSIHYDNPDMVIGPAPKIVLQNKLTKCRGKLGELQLVLVSRRQNLEQLTNLVTAYNEDHSLGNLDDVVSNFLDASHDLAFHKTSDCMLVAEIETIDKALGGDEGDQRPHQFKGASFSIPTQCGHCATSIWGLSKLGKTCKLCGISVHGKCELKVPATCTASRGTSNISVSRTSSTSTDSKKSARASTISSEAPSPSSFARVHPSSTVEESGKSARVIFEFAATSPFELSVAEGTIVTVLEEDDGSGWVKVADGSGGKGLVPGSYIETDNSQAPSSLNGQCVRGVYDYEAQGQDELNVRDGEMIQLTPGPNGGQNYADGWWEGIDSSGKKGIFPSNYVTLF